MIRTARHFEVKGNHRVGSYSALHRLRMVNRRLERVMKPIISVTMPMNFCTGRSALNRIRFEVPINAKRSVAQVMRMDSCGKTHEVNNNNSAYWSGIYLPLLGRAPLCTHESLIE